MKFLIDQQVPPDLAQWLIERGAEAVHVRDVGLRDSDDREIWRTALTQGMVIITKDEDFAARRAAADEGPRIIWLRIGNATNKVLFAWLSTRWANVEIALRDGATLI